MAAVLPNFRPTFEAIRRGRILMQVSAGFCSRKDMSLEKDALPLAVPQASSKTSPPVPESGSLPTPPAKEPKRQTFLAVSTSERAAIPPGCPLVVAVASVPFARGRRRVRRPRRGVVLPVSARRLRRGHRAADADAYPPFPAEQRFSSVKRFVGADQLCILGDRPRNPQVTSDHV